MRMRYVVLILAIIIILVLIGISSYIVSGSTYEFVKPIDDGDKYPIAIRGYGSRLYVSLKSSPDYMSVRIVADGRVIYDNPHTYNVSFDYYLGFGYHELNIVIENPKTSLFGTWIRVVGLIRYYLF
jgi:hypothetical protein